MRNLKKISGFTLIEIMIVIAIFTIIIAHLPLTEGVLRWFSGEEDYRRAIEYAKEEINRLKVEAWSKLPPEVFVVPPSTHIVSLSHYPIVKGSIEIRDEGGMKISPQNYEIDYENGKIKFSSTWSVKLVIIKYSFYHPSSLEAATIPTQLPFAIHLSNFPVIKVLGINKVSRDIFIPLKKESFSVDYKNGILNFNKSMSGKVIQVSYIGRKVTGTVSGDFLREDLSSCSSIPTSIKRINILETYGKNWNNSLNVTLLRMEGEI